MVFFLNFQFNNFNLGFSQLKSRTPFSYINRPCLKKKKYFFKMHQTKIGDCSEETRNYTDSLPTSFVNDPEAPPLFSYSWLQRIGRMDIFSEKIKEKKIVGKNLSSFFLGKTDPIFRIPKKKKKKKKKFQPGNRKTKRGKTSFVSR